VEPSGLVLSRNLRRPSAVDVIWAVLPETARPSELSRLRLWTEKPVLALLCGHFPPSVYSAVLGLVRETSHTIGTHALAAAARPEWSNRWTRFSYSLKPYHCEALRLAERSSDRRIRTNGGELADAIKLTLANHDGPTLIECFIDRDDCSSELISLGVLWLGRMLVPRAQSKKKPGMRRACNPALETEMMATIAI
jgi:hypothetical protein